MHNMTAGGYSGDFEHLWQRLETFQVGAADDALSFCQRLARENGWPLAYAQQVFHEYKRFIYLIAISGKHLTPSDAVDQAWHLHLAYTRSYWQDLCEGILGFALHHQPTRGGTQQLNYFKLCYSETLQFYRETFASAAPIAIWPALEERFNQTNRFSRINHRHAWVIPKPRHALAGITLAGLVPIVISACTPGEAEDPFWFWVKTAIGVVGFLLVARWINKSLGGGRSTGGSGGGCSSGGSGCSSGGCCGGGGD